MHSDAFDRYHHGHSLIHHIDPRVKVILTLALIVSNVMLPDGAWPAFTLMWLVLLILNRVSGLGFWFTFARSFIALPFALAAITVLFSPQGNSVLSIKILMWNLMISDYGLIHFASIVVRSWLSVQIAILLVATTQFPDIVHAFKHLHVPAILTTIIAFLYRYLFVLVDEVLRLLRAREARSAAASGSRSAGGVLWHAKVAGNMAGQLFLRSYERSDRIYNAMLARGYQGQMHTLNPHHYHLSDWLTLGASSILIIILQWIGRL